jgi:hypothetical protein
MPAENTSPSERIVAAFETLTKSAKNINDVSNELAKPIASLERALDRLNLAVACWSTFSQLEDEGDDYWKQEVGYARVKGEWCLAIRTAEGNYNLPQYAREEVWPFNEAPRYLRVKAVDKLPDLIEALVEATNATAKRLKEKVAPAQELADAVNTLVPQKKK